MTSDRRPTDPPFDGIVCFGREDWLGGERRYETEMMRAAARAGLPVLYVDPRGHAPSPAQLPARAAAMAHRLRGAVRGLAEVEPGLFLLCPAPLPPMARALLGENRLAMRVTRAVASLGMSRPLWWLADPSALSLLPASPPGLRVLQRADMTEAAPGQDTLAVAAHLRAAMTASDLTVFASEWLAGLEAGSASRHVVLPPGVELPASASLERRQVPPDIPHCTGPRIGCFMPVDGHAFRPAFVERVASIMLDSTFIIVGRRTLPRTWTGRANIECLGHRPAAAIGDYMAAMDVLIMPWSDDEWVQSHHPLQLREHIASGKPVVSTDLPALDGWRDLVYVADDPYRFAAAIRAALSATPRPRSMTRERLASETWQSRLTALGSALGEVESGLAAA